ncbi:Ultraviolet-B receptor UVR8, partial [Trichoplax sp. H2]
KNNQERIQTVSYKLSRKCVALALATANGNLILRFEENAKTNIRILPWLRNPQYAIRAMTFSPDGKWLVCVCINSVLFIVPALTLVKPKSLSGHPLWSIYDLTEITDTEISGNATCVVWWYSMDNKHLAIVGCEDGEVVFIDLVLRRKVTGFKLDNTTIKSMDIVRDFSETASYLLIHTVDYSLRMMLELIEKRSDLNSLKSMLHLDELQYRALLSEIKYSRRDTVITLQSGKGRHYLVSHNYKTNQVQIYDPEIDKQPLFEFKIFTGASHLCWNNKLMFTVTSEEWNRKLYILSSRLAEVNKQNNDFNYDSIIQSFQMPREDIIQIFIKEEAIPFAYTTGFQSENVALPTCVIVTSCGIYECRQRLHAEDILLELILSSAYKDYQRAEKFGFALHLDIDRIYQIAAEEKLESKCYTQCQKLLKRSRAEPVNVVRAFYRRDRISDSVIYLKQVSANLKDRGTRSVIKISNTTAFCYIMQLLIQAANGKSGHALRESFSQFLKRNESFTTEFVLKKLILTGFTDFIFEVAKTRGEIVFVMGSIVDRGHMHINIAAQDFLFTNHLITDVCRICNGALLRSMSMGSFIKFLLSEEDLFPRYFEYVRFLLPTLDPAILTFLAQQLDPLSTSLKCWQDEVAVIRQCLSNLCYSGVMVELFLIVLVGLSSKKHTSLLRKKDLAKVKSMSCGPAHCAIVVENEVHTLSYGLNHDGKLNKQDGFLMSVIRLSPFEKIAIKEVSCGAEHTVALTKQGVIYGWGSSSFGQLGSEAGCCYQQPSLIGFFNNPCITVACGFYHTLTITDDHSLWSWGWGIHGQLGHSRYENCHIPSLVKPDDCQHWCPIKISAGYAHSAVLTEKGSVYTFGSNIYGQCGLSFELRKQVKPRLINSFESARLLNCGPFHMAVVTYDEITFVWGRSQQDNLKKSLNPQSYDRLQKNLYLGDGKEFHVFEPKQVLIPTRGKILQVSCGLDYTIVLVKGGSVFIIRRGCIKEVATNSRSWNGPKNIQSVCGGYFYSVLTDDLGRAWVIDQIFDDVKCRIVKNITTTSGIDERKSLNDIEQDGTKLITKVDSSNNNLESDISFKPYNYDSVGIALSMLKGIYNNENLIRFCIDGMHWEFVSKLFDNCNLIPQTYRYQLKAILQHHNEGIVDRMITVTKECLQNYAGMVSDNKQTEIERLGSWLVGEIFNAWKVVNMPNEAIENILMDYLEVLSRCLIYLLYKQSHNGNVNIHSHMNRKIFTPSMCFNVKFINVALQMLENDKLSYAEVYQARFRSHSSNDGLIARHFCRDTGKNFDTYKRRWQQVANNVDKDISYEQCLSVSPALKRVSSGSSFDILRRDEDDVESRNIVIFGCGHSYSRDYFDSHVLKGYLDRSKLRDDKEATFSKTLIRLYSRAVTEQKIPSACIICVSKILSALK